MIEGIQHMPAFAGRNRFGRPFPALDLKRQLVVLLDVFGTHHLIRDKAASDATKRARAEIMFQSFKTLRMAGFPIKNVLNFSQRHIQALADNWNAAGLSAATLQTRFSVLRWFTAAIGKADMVKDAHAYGIEPARLQRTYAAQQDKSWIGNKLMPKPLIASIAEMDGWVAIRLELMSAFGLRISEAALFNPFEAHGGDSLRIEHGTKGGRNRIVPVRTEEQRTLIQRAKEIARLTTKRNLIPDGKTLKQALMRTYYVCNKFSISRKQLGVTPHGLRAEYACARYEQVSGMPSAVRGKPENYDAEADRKAREVVSRELGHTRTNITSAYTGARVRGRPRKKKAE